MKRQLEVLISISVLMIVAVAGGLCLDYYLLHRTLDPTPESASSFIGNYDPRPAIEARVAGHLIVTFFEVNDAQGGHGFITHQRSLQLSFSIDTGQRIPIMNSVSDDAYKQVVINGGFVTSRSGDPTTGYRIEYLLRQSTGKITVSPLAPDIGIRRNMPLRMALQT